MAQRSGINRALMWLRKTLQITETTDSPRVLSEILAPSIDVFGWERLNETTQLVTAGTNVNTVASPAVPADVLRLIVSASVETSNSVLAFHMWMDNLDFVSGTNIGVMRPIAVPISAIIIRNGFESRLFLRPGDVLAGRCTPSTGVGETLTLRQRFVDLPIGEYVRGF